MQDTIEIPRTIRERRAWPRAHKSIRVLLLPDDSALDEPFGGTILDMSRGGVRLAVQFDQISVGAMVGIRHPFAPGNVPWTWVRVRNCRFKTDGWELGCEFVQVPKARVG